MTDVPSPQPPLPDKLGLLLRVGLFVIIGWFGMMLFAYTLLLLMPDALMVTSVMSVFAAAAFANTIAVRIYERGRLSDLGLGWTATSSREFFLGMAAGAGAGVVVLAGPLLVRAAEVERVAESARVGHPLASFAYVSIVLLFGAVGEEMLFHGYAFQLLIRSFGAFATILPAAVLFGFAHMSNLNSNALGIFNTMTWGVLLGYAFARTKALWMPIGLHFGWNFALPLFGVNLSGFTMGVTGYTLHWRVNDLWSGGAYGPEGGLLTTVIVVVLFFVLVKLTPASSDVT